jgi:hypothetical protein
MEAQQTAVQWLKDKLFELEIKIDFKTHEEAFFIFEEAKALERKLLEKACDDAYDQGWIDANK